MTMQTGQRAWSLVAFLWVSQPFAAHASVTFAAVDHERPDAPVMYLAPSPDEHEPCGVKTYALKKALRAFSRMLRSSSLDDVLKWLARESDARVVQIVRRHALTIADTLDELILWEALTLKIIRDQLIGAIGSAGVPHSTSVRVAFWIEKFIEWTLL